MVGHGQRPLAVVINLPSPHRAALFDAVAPALRDAGWDLEVVFASRTNARRAWGLDPATFRFRHRFLESRNVRLGPGRVLNTYAGLVDALARIRPHAVVSVGFTPGTVRAAGYARRAGIPLAIWSGAVEGRERGFLRRMQRCWLVGRAQAFLAYGSAARDYLESLGAPPDAVRMAWNTHDLRPFLALDPVGRPGEALRLLYAGDLEKGKRVDLLLDAIHAARRAGVKVELDVVGDGSCRRELEARDVARFHGRLPHAAIPACLARAHAFAFPTGHDVWGFALLEAMAAGRPALASVRAGATRDLVVAGETGEAVDFEDTGAVVERLRAWALEPERIPAMGAAARARVRKRFGIERNVAAWLAMVKEW